MDPAALDYALDPALIAQRPLRERDGGRLLVVRRKEGVEAQSTVRDLPRWLRPGDLLVVNDAKVVPSRLLGRRAGGGRVEVLLAEPADEEGVWCCLGRKTGRLRAGERIDFAPGLEGIWEGVSQGCYQRIRMVVEGDLAAVIDRCGEVPLPPYIRRPQGPLAEDRVRYQTVFASVPGAIAAPTAGLHFTPTLLERLGARGVQHAALTLIVGAGTFVPVRTTSLETHSVPPESYEISDSTAAAIAATRAAGGRIVAVGTTTVRALESAAMGEDAGVRAGRGRTNLVIAPGFRFRVVDAIFTNLHLPRSSLLGLVAGFAGVEPTLAAYRLASGAGYRFYSYGDAMLVQ